MDVRPGVRFAVGGERGTLRFRGAVGGADGEWLGVEWDAPRGKHDGVGPDGQRYFACAPGHGAFLRASPRIDYGVAFLEAVRAKYTPSSLRTLRTVSVTGQAPPPALPDPSAVEVCCAYADAGEAGAIAATCPAVRWLDLSRSLLTSWDEVRRIADELPLLETLLLHEVRLAEPGDVAADAFRGVTHLQMDASAIDWAHATAIARMMPALQVLQLGANGMRHLAVPDTLLDPGYASAFSALRELNLAGNGIDDWQDVCEALGTLPRLERLVLSENTIASIPAPPVRHCYFPMLHDISLRENPITSWADLDALEAWLGPHAHTHGWSLALGGERAALAARGSDRDVRLEAIARLAHLSVLNRVPVHDEERRDAERYYVARVQRSASAQSDVDLARAHPRYAALCAAQNVPLRPEAAAEAPRTLRAQLVPVRVASRGTPPDAAAAPALLAADLAEVPLLCSAPVRLVTRRLAGALGVPPASVQEVWAVLRGAEGNDPLLEPLEADKTLAWYGIAERDVLVLVCR